MVHIDFGSQPRTVLGVDQEPRLTTLLDEIKAKRAGAFGGENSGGVAAVEIAATAEDMRALVEQIVELEKQTSVDQEGVAGAAASSTARPTQSGSGTRPWLRVVVAQQWWATRELKVAQVGVCAFLWQTSTVVGELADVSRDQRCAQQFHVPFMLCVEKVLRSG